MSTVMPCSGPPWTVSPAGVDSTVQPIRSRTCGKGGVALAGIQAQVGDGHPAAGEGRRGPEIRGAGGVGLDVIILGQIALAAGKLKIAVAFPVIGDAEVLQDLQGQVHVRPGDQFVGDLDLHALGGQRPDEEQGRDVLAADRAGELGPAALEAALDGDRRAAVAVLRGGLHPQLAQGLQKIAQGPLAEALGAGEEVVPCPRAARAVKKRMEVPELPR